MVICRPSSYLFAANTEFQTAPIGPFFIICLFTRNRSFMVRISRSILPFPCSRAPGRLFALFQTVCKTERTRYLPIPSLGSLLFFLVRHIVLCNVSRTQLLFSLSDCPKILRPAIRKNDLSILIYISSLLLHFGTGPQNLELFLRFVFFGV